MNQRGYRTSGGPAPIKENLAAVLLMLARHQAKSEALVDPMAGTGTIAIEAALMGAGRPVWIPPRRPAAESMESLRPWLASEAPALFGDTRPFVLANELKPTALSMCEEHVSKAGVNDSVECTRGDFRDLRYEAIQRRCRDRGVDPNRGLILCNPPYGERLDDPALPELYADLGTWCRQFRGWRAAFLVANPDFEVSFGGRPRIKKPLNNGSLKSFFVMYDL
jgi:23S rRNA G2445 N2-methylase RlmL